MPSRADEMLKGRMTETVNTNPPIEEGDEIWIEGLWHELTGKSWGVSQGNPAAMIFALRVATKDIKKFREDGTEPRRGDDFDDDEVFYVKDKNGLGHLLLAEEFEVVEND